MDKTKIFGGIAIGLATILCVGIASAAVRIADKPQDDSSSSIDTPIEPEAELTPTWEYLNFRAVNSSGGYITGLEAELSPLSVGLSVADGVVVEDIPMIVVPAEVTVTMDGSGLGIVNNKYKVKKFTVSYTRFAGGMFFDEFITKFYLYDGVESCNLKQSYQATMLRLPDDCVLTDPLYWACLREIRLAHGQYSNGSTTVGISNINPPDFPIKQLTVSEAFDDSDVTYWKSIFTNANYTGSELTIYCTSETETKARSVFEGKNVNITVKPLSEAPEYLK